MEKLIILIKEQIELGTDGIDIYQILIDSEETFNMVAEICSKLLLEYKDNKKVLVVITELLTATYIGF